MRRLEPCCCTYPEITTPEYDKDAISDHNTTQQNQLLSRRTLKIPQKTIPAQPSGPKPEGLSRIRAQELFKNE
jgi:hypothetical protein